MLAALLALGGCAEILSFLPKVIATVTDAQIILDKIEDFADAFFVASPDPQRQRNVDAALDRCRTALSVALRTTSGAEKLSKADAEAAAIYARAYGQDPKFYSLVKTLDLYRNLPEKEIDLLIGTDSEFFKYIKGIQD